MTPDQIKTHIAASLAVSHPGQDVKVIVGSVPFGNMLWDERTNSHVPFTAGEFFSILGFSNAIPKVVLKSWLINLSQVGFNPSLLKEIH